MIDIRFITSRKGDEPATEPFKCIRKRTTPNDLCKGKYVFIPVTDKEIENGSIFVRGRGHLNIKKAKVFLVGPLVVENENSIREYVELYGIEAAFYSLTGHLFDTWADDYYELASLVENPEQIEFYKDGKINKLYKELREEIIRGHEYYKEKYNTMYGTPNFFPLPKFSTFSMPMPIYMDAMQMNSELEKIYRAWRGDQLIEQYKEEYNIPKYDEEIKELYDKWTTIIPQNDEELARKETLRNKWNSLVEERRHKMCEFVEKSAKTIAKELDTDNDVFPQQVKARIAFFFGKPLANKVEEMINLLDSVK